MTDRLTCCPHCGTTFRTTEQQLQTARGSVRCGSCLKIFAALEHLIDSLPTGELNLDDLDLTAVEKRLQESETESRGDDFQLSAESDEDLTESEASLDELMLDQDIDLNQLDEELDEEFEHLLGEASEPVEPAATVQAEHRKELELADIEADRPDADSPEQDASGADSPEADEPGLEGPGTLPADAEAAASEPSETADSADGGAASEVSEQADSDALEPAGLEAPAETEQCPDAEADDSSESDSEPASTPPPEPQAAPGLADTQSFNPRYDDTVIEQLGELNTAFQKLGEFGERPGALFDRRLKVIDSHTQQFNTDETWAINLLEELESEDGRTQQEAPEPVTLSEHGNVGQFYTDPEPLDATRPDLSYVNLTAINAAFSSNSEPDVNDSEYGAEAESDEDTEYDYRLHSEPDEAEAARVRFLGSQSLDSALAPEFVNQDAQPSAFELLQKIAPAPVELDKPNAGHWQRRAGWASLCLLAILALAVQSAWYYRDILNQNPDLRPMVTRACAILGCELQPQRAPQLIKASNLIVRTHPEIDDALIIDCVLLNTAAHNQPFPDFTLVFTDLQGNLVAQRRFHPSDYLNGELAGADSMPSGQPIHINLEIVDPGEQAINYAAAIPLD